MRFSHLLRRLCGVLISLVCMGAVAPAFAANGGEALDLTRVQASPVALTAYFEYMEDHGAALTVKDVMDPARAGAFRQPASPYSAALGFSYTRSAVWLRLPLSNTSDQPLQRMLEINYALLAHIDFYAPDAQCGMTLYFPLLVHVNP